MTYRTIFPAPVNSFRRELDRFFDDAFRVGTQVTSWMPATDVREEPTALVIELELPGVAPEGVEVTTEQQVLTIRGDKPQVERKEGEEHRWHVVERGRGTFSRSFRLPEGYDLTGVTAESSHGVLTVRVPKAPVAQPRKVEVIAR